MFFRFILPGVIWGGIILILSVIPGESLPSFTVWDFFSIDKAGHLFFYAVLMFLLAYGFKKQYKYPNIRYRAGVYALLICAAYGIIIEVLQPQLITNRYFDYFDILANIIGCFVGTIIYSILYYKL